MTCAVILSAIMLNAVMLYAVMLECHYAECHYAESRGTNLSYRFGLEISILTLTDEPEKDS
jgi:hypothetical protein